MARHPPADDAAGRGSRDEDGLTLPRPGRARSGPSRALPRTEPSRAEAGPGRPQERTPEVDLDLERAEARARLRASLFQIEPEPLKIGRFTILSRLGRGGMGIVYSAYDEDLDRKVAIKVMLPQAESDVARDRMRREARAMARLSHPNIVTVHEVGSLGEQIYIAMEFVRGCSLEQWLGEQRRPWPEVLAVFGQAGQGLAAAHEAGLVHRDFKPPNVMVGDDGSVKVLDFGLARSERGLVSPSAAADADGGSLDGALTQTGALVGTPAYMSPEQYLGRPITARSDQFSFCVALYVGLYGVHPFEGSTLAELAASIGEGRVREPPADGRVSGRVPARIPARIQAAVVRGLAVDPQGRYPSMPALLDALSRDPKARRRRWIASGVALAAVFGGGVALAQLGGGSDDACPDARDALVRVWDQQRRDRVGDAWGSGELPWAGETWERVWPALDGYADTWVRARDQACEQRRQGVSTDLLYERTMACLDQGRARLDTLAEVFEQVDEAAVDRAVAAVAGLPSVSRCQDAERMLARIELPAAAIADEVAQLRQSLGRARSLEDLGRLDDGLALASSVRERAQALGYRPLLAEAWLGEGAIQLTARMAEGAEQSLGEALWIAIEAGHDAVAAEAAARRIFVRGELQRQLVPAQVELDWARALVAKAGDPILRGLLLNNGAAVARRLGDLPRAERMLQEALEIKRAALGPEHPEVAFSLVNMGHLLADRGSFTAATETLERAGTLIEAALGPRHPMRATVALKRSYIFIERGRFDDAERELVQAEALKRPGRDRKLRFEIGAKRARIAWEQRRWSEAQRRSEQVIALGTGSLGFAPHRVWQLRLGLARARAAMGERVEAEAIIQELLGQLEDAWGSDHPAVFTTWWRLGQLRLKDGAPARARAAFERARQVAQQLGPAQAADEALVRGWIGRTWLAEGELDRADPLIRAAVEILQRLEPPESPRIFDALEALGELEWARGHAAASAEALSAIESQMASHRPSDDPALAWVRARLARARFEAAPSERASALAQARRSLALLDTDVGWAREAAQTRAWLGEHTP
ncbi:MAG: serine/threonine-protein kinase [Myxococcota bacterium]